MGMQHKFHLLIEERLETEERYRIKCQSLRKLYQEKLKDIQERCSHKWEDGSSAWAWTTPPFSESYCAICLKPEKD